MITRRHLCAATLGAFALELAARASLAQTAPQTGYIRVPITLSESRMPVVELKLNGKGPYRFILDTGATHTIIRASLARELGLVAGTQETVGYSIKGTERLIPYVVPEVIIGGALRLRNWGVYGSRGWDDSDFDGLLSADLLTRMPCQLDYHASEIRYYLSRPMSLEGFTAVDGYFRTNIQGGADQVHLRLKLSGRSLDCLLDTGAGLPLYIRGDFVKKHKLWDQYPVLEPIRMTGVNGKVLEGRMVEISDLHIGGVKVPKLEVALGDPKDTAGYIRGDDSPPGLVGAGFLSDFVLAFAADRSLHIRAA
ncbi:MAG: aspartyl protease family protein [Asticcacaulis sp.]